MSGAYYILSDPISSDTINNVNGLELCKVDLGEKVFLF